MAYTMQPMSAYLADMVADGKFLLLPVPPSRNVIVHSVAKDGVTYATGAEITAYGSAIDAIDVAANEGARDEAIDLLLAGKITAINVGVAEDQLHATIDLINGDPAGSHLTAITDAYNTVVALKADAATLKGNTALDIYDPANWTV